jgi:NADP-dependent 3-hydroxy acid dehydrogenase YdfG
LNHNPETQKDMTKKLGGKVALITGASAGIGQACARALAGEGARLVLTARRRERLDASKKEAESLGAEAVSVIGDAREERTAIQTVKAAVDTFGRLDILINNTGVGNYKNLVDTSAEDYDGPHGHQCALDLPLYSARRARNA